VSETFDERLDYLAESIDRLEEHVELLQERCRQQDELIAVLFLAVRPPEMQDTLEGEFKFKRVVGHWEVTCWQMFVPIYPLFGDKR